MAVESPTFSEIKQQTAFSQKARGMLLILGVSTLPGSFRDNARIASRDTEGGCYPYNAGFSEYRKIRKDWTIVKDGVEIGFYYTGLKKDKNKKEIGEVGMVHLAPGVRDKGLSTPIRILGLIQLLEDGATKLRSVIGDKTGKVEAKIKELSFAKTERTLGIDNHPIWEIDIPNSKEKLDFFMQEFEKKLSKLKKDNLIFDPKTVDIDNPKRIPIEETILARLEQKTWNSSEQERILFGYPTAPVYIFKKGSDMLLRIPKINEKSHDSFEKSIKAILPDFDTSKIYTFPTDILVSDFEIEFTNLKSQEEARESAQKLSKIGQAFFEKAY